MPHRINWIEIPAVDHTRAVNFYSQLFGETITKGDVMGKAYSFLPNGLGAISGSDNVHPSGNGVTIYFNLGSEMTLVLEKVQEAGGSVVVPKSSLGEDGFFAIIHDSEGNRIGLHSDS